MGFWTWTRYNESKERWLIKKARPCPRWDEKEGRCMTKKLLVFHHEKYFIGGNRDHGQRVGTMDKWKFRCFPQQGFSQRLQQTCVLSFSERWNVTWNWHYNSKRRRKLNNEPSWDVLEGTRRIEHFCNSPCVNAWMKNCFGEFLTHGVISNEIFRYYRIYKKFLIFQEKKIIIVP